MDRTDASEPVRCPILPRSRGTHAAALISAASRASAAPKASPALIHARRRGRGRKATRTPSTTAARAAVASGWAGIGSMPVTFLVRLVIVIRALLPEDPPDTCASG